MKTSARPAAVRSRLRRNTEEIYEDIAILYKKPVEEWDWEELSRGCPRDEDGNFPKGKPKWITPVIDAEVRRRMRELTESELMKFGLEAMKTLSGLMQNEEVDDFGKPAVPAGVKADCAKYIMNQIIGTPVAKIITTSGSPLLDLMGSILVNPDGELSHDGSSSMVVEGEVDDEDEGDDD